MLVEIPKYLVIFIFQNMSLFSVDKICFHSRIQVSSSWQSPPCLTFLLISASRIYGLVFTLLGGITFFLGFVICSPWCIFWGSLTVQILFCFICEIEMQFFFFFYKICSTYSLSSVHLPILQSSLEILPLITQYWIICEIRFWGRK